MKAQCPDIDLKTHVHWLRSTHTPSGTPHRPMRRSSQSRRPFAEPNGDSDLDTMGFRRARLEASRKAQAHMTRSRSASRCIRSVDPPISIARSSHKPPTSYRSRNTKLRPTRYVASEFSLVATHSPRDSAPSYGSTALPRATYQQTHHGGPSVRVECTHRFDIPSFAPHSHRERDSRGQHSDRGHADIRLAPYRSRRVLPRHDRERGAGLRLSGRGQMFELLSATEFIALEEVYLCGLKASVPIV